MEGILSSPTLYAIARIPKRTDSIPHINKTYGK